MTYTKKNIGKSITNSDYNSKKWVAALLNGILSGAGYLYLGKRTVFATFLLLGELLFFVWIISHPLAIAQITTPDFMLAGTLWMIAFAYDAYKESDT